MKVLIILAVVCEVFSSRESVLPEIDNEPSRTSKGLHSNTKLVDNGNLFSPRMEYDEWTPLGRGDPLKNDPTYDYVPPVLERVHYWMEPSKRTPHPPVPNSGVLILGSSRTEPMFSITPKYQLIKVKEPQADSRLDTISFLDPFLKLMDVSKFGVNLNPSTNNHYKPGPNQNRIHSVNYQRPPAVVHHQYYNQRNQHPPQALQRPPYTMLVPPPPPSPTISSSMMTFATVTTTTEVTTTPGQTTKSAATTTASAVTGITKSNQETNITTIYPITVIGNTENLYKPVAIAMPEENETIRNEVKNSDLEMKPDDVTTRFRKETEKNSKESGNTPIPIQQQKRPVSEYKLKEPFKYRHTYERHPPPQYDNSLKQFHRVMTSLPKGEKADEKYPSSGQWGADNRATTSRPVTTTGAASSLTTDPMFKHYKQPSEPIKGPFYLIIQGHSKVKTYGASKNPINGLLTSNEIREDGEEKKHSYGKFYDLDSKERKRRRRGKSLRWFPSEANHLSDDERKKKFVRADVKSPVISDLSDFTDELEKVENLEDTFGKTEGGSSKKRFLVNDMMNEAIDESEVPAYRNRQLLSNEETPSTVSAPPMITVSHSTTGATGDSLDIESFIALNDDYTPEDVVSLLLKEEGQGSGFGNFVASIFGKSLTQQR